MTDVSNQLLEDDSFCYTYDENGNLETKVAKVASACTGNVTTYAYDVLNRLSAIDFDGGDFASYRYDALGRRIEKNVNGTITRYLYQGLHIVLEYDEIDTLLARYSSSDGFDQTLTVERGGQNYYYHADRLGSIRKITDSSGNVVSSYDYDSYGRLQNVTEGIPNSFTFTAREFDSESGLYFYRARYYDASNGRFLQTDPMKFIGNDLNPYRYALNNPINRVDPVGLNSIGKAINSVKSAVLAPTINATSAGIGLLFVTAVSAIILANNADDDSKES